MKSFFETDLQQTQSGFSMIILCQNMCTVNVKIAAKFQANICMRCDFIAFKGVKNVPSVTFFA